MKNKWLIFVFVILAGAYFISQVVNKRPTSSFTEDIIQVDAERVDKISVIPKAGGGVPFDLVKDSENWTVQSVESENDAMNDLVNQLISMVNDVKAQRIVAKKKESWPTYEIEDNTSKKIQFYSKGKLINEIVLGRFDFDQQAKSATSFVRVMNDDNIYATDGLLSLTLAPSAEAFRNKDIVSVPKDQVKSIRLTSNAFSKENTWVDTQGMAVDSTAVEKYLDAVINSSGTTFVDNFNASSSQKLNSLKLVDASNNELVNIDLYAGQDTVNPFVIHSSQNAANFFSSDSFGLYKTIFAPDFLED